MTAEAPTAGTGGVLAGVRVLDLTRALAGPYCAMLLADLGADVVKIEPPGGDGTRRTGPFAPDDTEHAFGGYFHSVNRNKRSIVVDLKRPEGREILRTAVRSADVLVENYRVGVMDRLGLGYESLRELNPRLVYGALRGFGDPRTGESPYQDWPALDVVAQAMGGLMQITGPEGQPTKVGPGVGDLFPAALCALGIVSALHHAERTGVGQFVDVSMYDAVVSLCERMIYQHSYTGVVPGGEGNGHPLFAPFGLFEAKDGWVAIAATSDANWAILCAAMGRPEYTVDPRFATAQARGAHNREVQDVVTEWTLTRTKSEVVAALAGRVPCGPVNTAADIFADPHVKSRNMLVTVEQPGSRHDVVLAGTPIKFTATPVAAHRRGRRLGEDTVEVLVGLGYSAEQIERLRAEDVVT